MMKNFLSKKASDLTVGETLKFAGIVTLATTALSAIPLIGIYKDEISDWFSAKFKRKEAKPALSTEEEDDWGV